MENRENEDVAWNKNREEDLSVLIGDGNDTNIKLEMRL
jgi:hypothetical protein